MQKAEFIINREGKHQGSEKLIALLQNMNSTMRTQALSMTCSSHSGFSFLKAMDDGE